MTSITEKSSIAYLLLSVVIFIWGLNFSLVKWAVASVPPLPFNVVRYTLASVVIVALLLATEGWRDIPLRDGLKLLVLGLVGHSFYQVLFIKGISLTTAGNSSLFIATAPIWTGTLAAILGREKLGKKGWFGTLLGFFGVFLVTLGGGNISFGGSGTTGDVLTLSAALSLATYTVLSESLLEKYSPLRLTAITMSFGSIGLWVFAGRSVIQQNWVAVPGRVWGVLVYSALLAVVVGYLVWFTAVQVVGPSRTAIFNNLTPIIAFALAFFLLGEPVTLLQVAGGITVLVGIGLTVRS
ncbi:DMT family transporter [Candidatus Bipolaricaulota bacterium]|nr:DMT family transporter [Candidatus Bipolaricaulota bacterium]